MHSTDESGFAIGLVVAERTPVEIPAADMNYHTNITRLNTPVMPDARVKPVRMGHVVYGIQRAMRNEPAPFIWIGSASS